MRNAGFKLVVPVAVVTEEGLPRKDAVTSTVCV